MGTVNAVAHVRWFGQGLKSVRTSCRDVEGHLRVTPKFETRPVSVRRGHGPEVDDHIENRTVRAANQFRLPLAAPYVETAHYASGRTRDAVLGKASWIDPSVTHHLCIECAAEKTTLVDIGRRFKQHHTGNLRHIMDGHTTFVARRTPDAGLGGSLAAGWRTCAVTTHGLRRSPVAQRPTSNREGGYRTAVSP